MQVSEKTNLDLYGKFYLPTNIEKYFFWKSPANTDATYHMRWVVKLTCLKTWWMPTSYHHTCDSSNKETTKKNAQKFPRKLKNWTENHLGDIPHTYFGC